MSETAAHAVIDPDIRDVRAIDDGVELHLDVPERLSYFEGHFPGRPILPGVVQVDWAARMADRYLGTSIGGAQNYRVKFRAPVGPGPLVLRLMRPDGKMRLSFEFRRADIVVSSGSIELTA